MKDKISGFLFACCFALALLITVPAQAGALLADLENALMCKCDDKCGKVLINCTCDTSEKTREELQGRLDSGLTVDQIVQIYVDKYGETILSAPTKSGFNLAAWLTPFAALVGGGWGIRKIVSSWLKKNSEVLADSPGNESSKKSVSDESGYGNKLKQELDNFEI